MKITKDYRAYLGKVLTANNKLLDLYHTTLNKYKDENDHVDIKTAFSKGEFFKDYISASYDILGFSDFIIRTKSDTEIDKKVADSNKPPYLNGDSKEIKAIAKSFTTKLLHKENIKLIDMNVSPGNNYLQYSVEENGKYAVNLYRDHGGVYEYLYYVNYKYDGPSEDTLQNVLDNIIKNLGLKNLYLLSKDTDKFTNENNSKRIISSYLFIFKINDMYDYTRKFSVDLNMDGSIKRLVLSNLNDLYSNEYHVPTLSKEDLKKSIDENYRDKISKILYMKDNNYNYIYEVTINEFGTSTYIIFDADTGEKLYVSDKPYKR